jgi:hypothetical protein
MVIVGSFLWVARKGGRTHGRFAREATNVIVVVLADVLAPVALEREAPRPRQFQPDRLPVARGDSEA